MKNTAIKIVSGVLVVALVVVAALAIAGVFNVRTSNDVAFAEGDAAVNEQHMFRNFDANTVLYIRTVDGSTPNGDADMFIHVVDNEYSSVRMVKAATTDENGNIGLKPADGWKEGMFYSVSLAAGYVFVNEEYEGLDSFMCIVKGRESTDADTKVKSSVIMLEAGKFSANAYPDNPDLYSLTVQGARPEGEELVFVYEDGINSKAYRKANMGAVIENADSYTLTVENADVADVYEYIYVNKTYDAEEVDIEFNYADTEASIRSSVWYLAAMEYLYGEELDDVKKDEAKWVDFKFEPGFEPGSPSKVKLNISVTFNVFKNSEGKPDPSKGGIVVKIANTITPVFDVHIQNNDGGKSFDVGLDLAIETAASLDAKYAQSWSSHDEKDNKLKDIANGLNKLVSSICSNDKYKDNSQIFATWMIPIGNLPICIQDSLGFELSASFAGEVGAVATNKFHANFGVVYVSGNLQGYHNVDDTFHFDNISLAGTAGARFGLFNEVGISAYGTISVNLGIHAGVYADIAGRLSLSGDDIIALFKNEKSINIVAAYYFETGIYASLDVNGKVFGFTIAKATLLDKKFPLYSAGHKYLPMSYTKTAEEDTIYMQNSYYYITGWDVNALDIQSITAPESAMNLAWSEFDYDLGPNLRMDGNIIYAKTADEFESYITVTSKVNKDLVKTIKVVKNPEGPTTTNAEEVYDVNDPYDCYWNVMLNSSKFLGVTLDGVALTENQYSFDNNTLRINSAVFAGKAYGTHDVVVEASKGYLKLVARVINTADVEVDAKALTFDKKTPSSLVWDMKLQGNAITSVVENTAGVSSKYYSYRESAGQFVMLASYWDGKAVGNYTVKVTLSNGAVYDLAVVVADSRAAKMNTTVYEYVIGSGDLALDVETYDNSANVVSAVKLDGTGKKVDDAIVPASLLADKPAGTYYGTVTVGGSELSFSVNVTASSDALVVPVKKKVFYKSSNEDVVFQAKIPANANVTIAGCDGYEVGAASITIKADYLKAQKGTEWKGLVNNSIELTVSLVNDVMPSLANTTFVSNGSAFNVAWDLQDVSVEDIAIEGLSADQYDVYSGYLTVKPATLGYGETVVTIYTPVNSMSFSVKREGTPTIDSNVTVNKNEATVAEYALNTAHLDFSHVEVDGATILASGYRYNNGVLTLSNEFVYNLAAGTYNLHVYLSDDSKLDATLTVNGDIAKVNAIGRGSVAEPYLIYTAEQLAAVATYVNQGNESTSYRLMADINMHGYSMTPIGSDGHAYAGTFDGNGYTISNLTISEPVKVGKDGYAIGMFGLVGKGGVVKGLILNSAKVSFAKSGSVSAGIIAGRNNGTITNVTVADGSISAESKSWLDIKNAYFDLGAVVGYNSEGYIANVTVEANIVGKVKGLNVLGIQIGGRKSLINVGAVVGYFTTTADKTLVKNIQVTASISCESDNNSVNTNGWYGYTDLSETEAAACLGKRVRVFIK